ncbi:MAG: protein translocase subunit SecD, partial [Christensenellaceae bacterium]|nr:protein translocase subunit SecD [Christensenellaceae bacterium]
IDSNVTTLIAAVVLALYGTGSIKGFAYTLAISIVVSLFTAVVVTQGLMKLMVNIAPRGSRMYFPAKKEKAETEGGAAK